MEDSVSLKSNARLVDSIDLQLISRLPESIIRRHKAIPVKRGKGGLTVAMPDPYDVVAIDDLRLATGGDIYPVYVPLNEIEAAIQKIFGVTGLKEALADFEIADRDTLHLDMHDESTGDEAPVIKLVNTIIAQAIEGRASDIHIEPNEHFVKVRYRIDGILREHMRLPCNSRSAVISRVKILAQLDIAEKRLPQDGRIKIKYQGRDIDLRISTIPVIFGEKAVIRILDKNTGLFRIDQLGFTEHNLQLFRNMLGNSHGMILLTGPSGSGKTTTLYAALNEMEIADRNIITIEDPVEYILDGINQVQINPKAGLTFANGLRSIVRQDPDVIMVGEIRDAETAHIAIHAATTGHLVLSTLHTNDAAGAIARLLDMGVEPYLAAASITGIVAQRLVRRLCVHCRKPYTPGPGSPESVFLGNIPGEEVTLYDATGCEHCDGTGFHGRIGIQELLFVTDKLNPLFEKNITTADIRKQVLGEGVVSLEKDGTEKALEGFTTLGEVMRTCLG